MSQKGISARIVIQNVSYLYLLQNTISSSWKCTSRWWLRPRAFQTRRKPTYQFIPPLVLNQSPRFFVLEHSVWKKTFAIKPLECEPQRQVLHPWHTNESGVTHHPSPAERIQTSWCNAMVHVKHLHSCVRSRCPCTLFIARSSRRGRSNTPFWKNRRLFTPVDRELSE